MFFELKNVEDKKLEADYKQMMSELNEFYGIDWVRNLPRIFFVESRKQIDFLRGCKTNNWSVGWVENTTVYVLKNEKMAEESSHKIRSNEDYYKLVKHELSHVFFKVLCDFSQSKPKWLWEGVAIYTSGQDSSRKKITEFKDFLNFYEQESVEGVYKESGFAVELLVKKFGKEKLLDLIKNLKNYPSKELFEKAFEKQYGFYPNFENFNSLM